jgi:histidyl-tRNA synthetase
MIGKFLQSKENIPACGFSIGFERVISILEEQKFEIPKSQNKIALLYSDKTDSIDSLLSKAQELREESNIVCIEIKAKNLSKQLDKLSEQGFKSFAIFTEGQSLEVKPLNKSPEA